MAKITKLGVGESLVGEGNEVAHIDLMIGPRGSTAESAFAHALVNNKDGFTTLLAVVAPNLLAKPNTILFNKVTIKGAKQAVQMFGPAQHAVAKAVADSVAEGVIPVGRGRRSLHLRWRIHPLGSQRRQEDPRLQLSRYQRSDFPRRPRRAEGSRSRCKARFRETSVFTVLIRKGAIADRKGSHSAPLFYGALRKCSAPRRPSCRAEATSTPAIPAFCKSRRSSGPRTPPAA